MKRRWMLLGGVMFAGALAFVYTGLAGAASFRASDSVNIGADQVVDSSIFAAGQNIDIAGEVHGDIYCAGRNVTISAKVDGDIICAGDQVRVSGPVSGSIRLAGRVVDVNGKVGGSASLAGSELSTGDGSSIGRDFSAAGENLNINGSIRRDANLAGASMRVGGSVGRSLDVRTENITLGRDAVVGGDFHYRSPNTARLESGAQVKGSTNYSPINKRNHISNMNFRRFFAGAFFYWLLATVATTAVLALLAPRLLGTSTEVITARPGRTALLGLVTLLAMPFLLGFLFVSLVGIPLGVVVLLLWLLGLVLSPTLFAVFIGKRLFAGSSLIVASVAGSLILLMAYWIPVVGFIAGIAALLLGLGSYVTIILQRASSRPVFAQPAHRRKKDNKESKQKPKTGAKKSKSSGK